MSALWFAGDVHGKFWHILKAVEKAPLGERPAAVLFLGDLDPQERLSKIFQRFLEAGIEPWFVHGNHESDYADTWSHTLDAWERNLHGRVETIAGVRVAGLGGVFRSETWYPPGPAEFYSYDEYIKHLESIQPARLRDEVGNSKRARVHSSSIFPNVIEELSRLRADVLVTHEASGICRNGFSVIDDVARKLQVRKVFSGHHHHDQHHDRHISELGFCSYQVGLRGIRDYAGGIIKTGDSR